MPTLARAPVQVRVPFQRSVITNGLRDGHGQYLIVTFVANTDKTIAHGLGRAPLGYLTIRIPSGGSPVTDGSNNGSDWTSSAVVLRTPVSGTYTVYLL